ncbi:hypothetical protein GCM10029963_20830 [Micromonospora andamanensis]
MDGPDVELPENVALAWGLRDRPSRGPKRSLSLDQVVAAGIQIAQAEGLAAVSMSRVAGELGVATMSLYRYVPTKHDLLDLMVDTAFGPPPPPRGVDEGWRPALSRWGEETSQRCADSPGCGTCRSVAPDQPQPGALAGVRARRAARHRAPRQ